MADEENWRGVFRLECKAGKQIQAIATKYLAGEGQSNRSRAVGDLRPFAFLAMPDGWGSEGLIVIRKSVFLAFLRSGATPGPTGEERQELHERDGADGDNDDPGLQVRHQT